jgi:hypothetical protein
VSSLRLRTTKSIKAPRVRRWGVVLIRSRGELLGYVEAPDLKAAEAAAVKAFAFTDFQRKRLLLRERNAQLRPSRAPPAAA